MPTLNDRQALLDNVYAIVESYCDQRRDLVRQKVRQYLNPSICDPDTAADLLDDALDYYAMLNDSTDY